MSYLFISIPNNSTALEIGIELREIAKEIEAGKTRGNYWFLKKAHE